MRARLLAAMTAAILAVPLLAAADADAASADHKCDQAMGAEEKCSDHTCDQGVGGEGKCDEDNG